MPDACVQHQASIVDRDGGTLGVADVLIGVAWGRILDDVSGAEVIVQPRGDCCEWIGQVRTWRHKLVIHRGGQPVWEGPIIGISWSADRVQIVAADVLAWLERRVPHRDQTFTGTDLVNVADWLIRDGYQPDDPGHTVEIIGRSGIRGDREYERDVGQTMDHLRDLAATGLDFTAVGSRIVLLPEDYVARIGTLTDDDFPDGLTVNEDGAALATRWVVWGRDDVKGVAGGSDPYYHLLEQVSEENSILDNRSAAAAARSRLRASRPAPVFLDSSEATLSPDAAIAVASLVPGWSVNVVSEATCRSINQTLKIVAMSVSENENGETVGITLAPVGSGLVPVEQVPEDSGD